LPHRRLPRQKTPPRQAEQQRQRERYKRARCRYEGLRAKAASTAFPDEAAACNAKADQLRDKYGL
jgi:Protein of unknown function (DUF2786)